MLKVTVTSTIRREYQDGPTSHIGSGETDPSVRFTETRDITMRRRLEDVEDVVWALEADRHEVVWDLWQDFADDEAFAEWGWHGYPKGDITVGSGHPTEFHDVAEYIAERDDADIAGVYLTLAHHGRVTDDPPSRTLLGFLCEHLAERGIDTDHWTFGRSTD